MADLKRLIPEIREPLADLEVLRSQPSPLTENWRRLHF
jgi:hypothetical protein